MVPANWNSYAMRLALFRWRQVRERVHRFDKLIKNELVSELSTAKSHVAGNNRVSSGAARRTIEEMEGRQREG